MMEFSMTVPAVPPKTPAHSVSMTPYVRQILNGLPTGHCVEIDY
ncbi:hypothetical protein [Prosthecobacter sp.]